MRSASCRLAVIVGLGLASVSVAAAADQTPTAGTEVFTGRDEAKQAREKPALPATTYWRVQAFMKLGAANPGAHAQMLVPLSDARQQVLTRRIITDGWNFREEPQRDNLWGHWTLTRPGSGVAEVGYEVTVAASDYERRLSRAPLKSFTAPPDAQVDLAPSPDLEADIAGTLDRSFGDRVRYTQAQAIAMLRFGPRLSDPAIRTAAALTVGSFFRTLQEILASMSHASATARLTSFDVWYGARCAPAR